MGGGVGRRMGSDEGEEQKTDMDMIVYMEHEDEKQIKRRMEGIWYIFLVCTQPYWIQKYVEIWHGFWFTKLVIKVLFLKTSDFSVQTHGPQMGLFLQDGNFGH